jgi:hypothetical protein
MATSLEVLLSHWPTQHQPQQKQQQQYPSTSPSTRPSSRHQQRTLYYQYQQSLQSSSPNQYRNLPGTTAYDLEQRSIALGELLVRRKWIHPDVAGFEDLISSSCSPQLYENNENFPSEQDDEDEQDNANERRENVTYQPLNVCVNLDEKKAVASVWLLARIGRFSSSSSASTSPNSSSAVEYEETVTVLHWWRRRKAWECFRQSGMKVVGS